MHSHYILLLIISQLTCTVWARPASIQVPEDLQLHNVSAVGDGGAMPIRPDLVSGSSFLQSGASGKMVASPSPLDSFIVLQAQSSVRVSATPRTRDQAPYAASLETAIVTADQLTTPSPDFSFIIQHSYRRRNGTLASVIKHHEVRTSRRTRAFTSPTTTSAKARPSLSTNRYLVEVVVHPQLPAENSTRFEGERAGPLRSVMSQVNDALDVLLGALPTDQAANLVSQLSITRPVAQTTSSPTTGPTSPSIVSSSSVFTSTSSVPTSSQASATTSSASPAPTVGSTNASPSSAAPPAAVPAPKSAGAIAGIVIGSIAALVLIILLALYLFRLRKRNIRKRNGYSAPTPSGGSGSSLLGSMRRFRRKKPAVYPEVAWLYDPVRPARDSDDSGPRLGSNAPWSSRPSISTDRARERPMTPVMAELPGAVQQQPLLHAQQHLSPGVFQSPNRSRSPSQSADVRRFSRPFAPADQPPQRQDNASEDLISPLLPPPARFSSRDGDRPTYGHSPVRGYDARGVHEQVVSPEGDPRRDGDRLSRNFVVGADENRPPVTKMGRAF